MSELESHYYFQKQIAKLRDSIVRGKRSGKIRFSSSTASSQRKKSSSEHKLEEESSDMFDLKASSDEGSDKRRQKLKEWDDMVRIFDGESSKGNGVSWRPFDYL
jgi:hypothetical protein